MCQGSNQCISKSGFICVTSSVNSILSQLCLFPLNLLGLVLLYFYLILVKKKKKKLCHCIIVTPPMFLQGTSDTFSFIFYFNFRTLIY